MAQYVATARRLDSDHRRTTRMVREPIAVRRPFPRSDRPSRGTTLAELLVALAIAALLLVIAMPSYHDWIAEYHVDHEARSLALGMQLARAEAIKRGHRVNLCKSADGRTCATAGSWAAGFLVHVDPNHDGSIDVDEAVLRIEGPAPAGVYVRANAPLDDYVSYTSLGTARQLNGALQMGTMRVCSSGRREVQVVLANSGRVRIQRSAVTCP
jgi:type IV fimbrial biogenesis protein FimT